MSPESAEVFQYAVLRAMPSQERGESLNVGVVLFCRRRSFLAARTRVDRERLAALDPGLDADALDEHLDAIVRIAAGERDAGPVAALDRSERFGWVVAPSSTIVQPSPVHTGRSDDPAAALERLLQRLVTVRTSG